MAMLSGMHKRQFFSKLARLLALAAMLHASSSLATGGPPMITDDPGTPGDGHWEINVATLSTHVAGSTLYQLPLIDANYGYGDRIQLKYEMPWLQQVGPDGARPSGIGDGLAGVKWRFYDAGENGWQISTYPQFEFAVPKSSAVRNGLADAGNSFWAPLEFVHAYGDYDINLEVGRWFRPEKRGDSWMTGFVLTREINKGFELMLELHEEIAVNQSRQEQILNFGARYDFSEHYTLLLAAGRDLRNTLDKTNTLLTYVGLQFKF
jgi:hypothetical protein